MPNLCGYYQRCLRWVFLKVTIIGIAEKIVQNDSKRETESYSRKFQVDKGN
jgi:hypothetical protein